MATGSQDDVGSNWKATQSALNVLESLLRCKICMKLFRNPVTLNVCGHTFCYVCCHPVATMSTCHCPECGVPVWIRELNPNRQLNNIIIALTNIKKVISNRPPLLTDEGTTDGNQEMPCDFLDIINMEQVEPAARDCQSTSALVSGMTAVGGRDLDRLRRRVKRNVPARRQGCSRGSHASHVASLSGNQAAQSASKRKCCITPTCEEDNPDILGVCSSSSELSKPSALIAQPEVQINSVVHRDLSNRSLSQSDVDIDLSRVSCDSSILKKIRSSRNAFVHPDKSACNEVPADCNEAIFIGGTPARKGTRCTDKLPSCVNSLSKRVPRKRNFKGETPLHISAIKGDEACAEMLLQLGADPNAKDYAGWTPLHDASHHGHASVVSVLLDNGALINVPGFDNNTALHEAVANGCGEVTTILLQRGALTNLRNGRGKTASVLSEYKWLDEIFSQVSADSGQATPLPMLKSIHASPELNGGMDSVVLISTGLHQYQKVLLANVALCLNAEVTDIFSSKVSHVVANCGMDGVCLRTYKLLCGIATGKWIVTFEWISRCSSERKWMDETPYEVCNVMTVDSPRTSVACKRARESHLFGAPGLFDGCHFYLHGSFSPSQPSRDELFVLIQSSQGSLILREPHLNTDFEMRSFPYHAKSSSTCNMYIVFDPTGHDLREKEKLKELSKKNSTAAIVSIGWIIDCLTNFQLLPIPL